MFLTARCSTPAAARVSAAKSRRMVPGAQRNGSVSEPTSERSVATASGPRQKVMNTGPDVRYATAWVAVSPEEPFLFR